VPKWVACSQKVHLTVAYCDAIVDRVGRGSMFPRVNVVLRYGSGCRCEPADTAMAEIHLCDLLLLKVDRGVGCSITSLALRQRAVLADLTRLLPRLAALHCSIRGAAWQRSRTRR
jgi:hypothetical protein